MPDMQAMSYNIRNGECLVLVKSAFLYFCAIRGPYAIYIEQAVFFLKVILPTQPKIKIGHLTVEKKATYAASLSNCRVKKKTIQEL